METKRLYALFGGIRLRKSKPRVLVAKPGRVYRVSERTTWFDLFASVVLGAYTTLTIHTYSVQECRLAADRPKPKVPPVFRPRTKPESTPPASAKSKSESTTPASNKSKSATLPKTKPAPN